MAALQPDLLGLQEVVYVDAAGPAHRGGRGGSLRHRPRLGRPARVRQQPAGPRAARRRPTWTAWTSGSAGRRTGRSSRCRDGARRARRGTHLHHEWPATRSATSRHGCSSTGWRPRPWPRPGRRWATSTRIRRSRPPSGCEPPGSAPPWPRRTATTPPSPGRPGSRPPAMDTDGDPSCLDYIWVRGPVRVRRRAARVRPAGPGRPDALPERSPRAVGDPRDRDGRIAGGPLSTARTLRLAHRGDWRAGRRRTRSPAFRAALAHRPPATGSNSTSGWPPTACPSSATTTRSGGCRVGPRPWRALTAGGARATRRPDARRTSSPPSAGAPFLDVELKVDAGPSGRRGPGGGAWSGARPRRGVVVRSRGARRDRPPAPPAGRAGSTRSRSTSAVLARRPRARLPRHLRRLGGARPGVDRAGAPRPGSRSAAWTVRRRSTFDRLASLGVIAVCVEAAALDG